MEILPENFGSLLATAAFVSLMNERVVEVFIAVWFKRYNLDGFWLVPTAWVTGGLLMFATGQNLFDWLFPNDWIGLLVSAVVVGGGSNLLHQVFSVADAIKEIARSAPNRNES